MLAVLLIVALVVKKETGFVYIFCVKMGSHNKEIYSGVKNNHCLSL